MRSRFCGNPALWAALLAVGVLLLAGCSGSHSSSSPTDPSPSATIAAPADPQLVAAVAAYRTYVDGQLDQLAVRTRTLVHEIDEGDIAGARRAYAAARPAYERIEPAAEIWGRLDQDLDGRANQVVAPTPFLGFHRVEQSLWTGAFTAATRARLGPVDDALIGDVRRLRTLAAGVHYTVLELTSGATELLGEIEANKITGEEERYSHLDLVDIRANVAGVAEVVTVLRPFLLEHDPRLLATIDQRAAVVATTLAREAQSPGYDGSGYRRFTDVPVVERRNIAAAVQALAEPVSLLTQATVR